MNIELDGAGWVVEGVFSLGENRSEQILGIIFIKISICEFCFKSNYA